MKSRCMIGTIRNISKQLDEAIKREIKKRNLPILMNHIALFYILPEDGTPMVFNELMNTWGIAKSSLSEMITRYSAEGFVEKSMCSNDKRTNTIKLCPKGLEIKKEFMQIENELLEKLMVNFSSEEKILLEMLLNRIDPCKMKL